MFAYNARPPDPAARRRALARDVAASGCDNTVLLIGELAAPSAARRLLEARLGLRGLLRDRMPGLRGRRLGRRLHQRDPAPARRPHLPAEGSDRPLGAQVPALAPARAADRLPPGGAALVGPLAEGHRHRHHGRAAIPGLDAEERSAPVHYSWRPGRWVAEPIWPAANIDQRRFYLSPGRLDEQAAVETSLEIHSPQWLGFSAGEWCPHGLTNDLPADQQFDDGAALCFETGRARGGLRNPGRAAGRA